MMALTGIVACLTMSAAEPLTVAFDDDGMITINGKRTLIVGSYYAAKSDRPFDEMAEAGFNLIHVAADPDALDTAHAAGLMAWATVGAIDPDKRDESSQAIAAAVDRIKEHPALALIETVDEPAWTFMKADQRVPWQVLEETYRIIKARDARHLVYTNQAPTNLVKTLRQYNAGTDVVACDIYPVNPGSKPGFALFPDGHQGDLNNEHISQVGEYVDKMRQVTGPNRPLLMVLQAFAWEALEDEPGIKERREEKIQYPSYAQSRFMAFQSLIKSANGIVYWGSHSMPQPSQAWTDIKRVAREIADLAGPLSTRTASLRPGIDYHEMGHSVDDGVQTLAKEHEGLLYLFTCNADKNFCKATLSGLDGWTSCTVLNEDRTLPVENGAITDTWRRFDVHVYRFAK
ncbi:MAG TPA: hypothetical protein P5318_06040 [Candidatus Hydrogenedentes bacterium]|nr:hypothetical protein [Candidatus Hydrogenedentota bacterium]HOV74167.1 hypothetical protein [Candidatus Hydrogenedentota bacterium]HPC15706.1 hypothetical protein [Candidatus Hydrogenedentota bacterium]HRT19670.1 hypothetical protein [Candidatus Hydrogenedentota bacterium]HRT64444.1 hypothetical protein [Candidatus Hydrogenedentota bacterium]